LEQINNKTKKAGLKPAFFYIAVYLAMLNLEVESTHKSTIVD